ncbi:MAG TPA: transcriptional regulator GcvA [Magnetospirillum sp.]|jgi:LysR family glycine cleavage system transcriptional activator|nr:transcriptional regulator GcvA [Magnetospirillum sp.]
MVRRLPPLRSLRAFEAAARHLSFARAADELHVTPAAISQQVKILEQFLGVALFRRGAQLSLTEAAANALPLVSDSFDLMERAVERLRQGRDGGPLVVSASPSFAARWLIPRMARFQERHPDIDLRLSASIRLVDFDTEDVDVAIRYGGGRYPGLHVERLKAEEVVPVANPHLAKRLKQPADLLEVGLLHNASLDWDTTFPTWPGWLANAGVMVPPEVQARRFDDFNLVLQAVLAGLGVALMWRTLVTDELADGRLVALFPAQPLVNAYHLVCPPKYLDNPKVAAFRAWVREEVEAG